MNRLVQIAALLLATASASAQERVQLAPRFTPGQTLRYALDLRSEQEGGMGGGIQSPQGPRKAEISISALMRIEVLSAEPAAAGRGERFRLRGTYEKIASSTKLDVPEPDADSERQLEKLQGRSVEFTVDAAGQVTEVAGLKDVMPQESGPAAQWLGQFGIGAGSPREGVVPGQSWQLAERTLQGTPITGVVWHGRSTYVRNEPCRAALQGVEKESAAAREMCAVILTQFETVSRGSAAGATPEEYRRSHLRSSGRITGAGESLAYVSLANGWLVSITQTSSESSDVTITALESGLQVRYTGQAKNQSSITLVKEAPPREAP